MAEKVEIKGGELDGSVLQNAASEATLVRLVELLEQQNVKNRGGAGSTTAASQQTTRLQELYNRSLKQSDKELSTLEKSSKKASGALSNLAKDAASMLKGLVNQIDRTVSSGLSLAFSSATPKITELTDTLGNALGPAGNTIKTLGSLLQETITDFKDLSQSGADLGNSLLDVKRRAVEAGLSVENFKKVVVDNSAGLATFGGTVGQGAARFAKINGALEKQFGPALSRLGISMDEAAENTASYMILQQRLGRLNSMSSDQITQGAMRYNLELDKLARATGVQRKEIEKNNQTLQTEARFKATLAKLDADQSAAISAEIGKLEKLDPSGRLANALKDIIGSGGRTLTEGSQMLALAMRDAGVDITKIGREIFKGNANAINEIAPAFAKLGESGSKLSDGQLDLVGIAETLGKQIPTTFAILARGAQDTFKNLQNAVNEQTGAINNTGKNMADVDRVLQNAKNSLNTALMPVLEQLNVAGANLLTQLQPGGPLLSSIEQYSQGVANSLTNFLEVLGTQGPGEAFAQLWSDLTTFAKPHIANMIDGMGTFFKQHILTSLSPAMAGGIIALFTAPMVIGALATAVAGLFAANAIRSAAGMGRPELMGPPKPAPRMGGAVKGGIAGLAVGGAASVAANALGRETKTGASADVLGSAASYAGTGAMLGMLLGPKGAALGAALGGIYGLGSGLWANKDTLFGGKKDQTAEIQKEVADQISKNQTATTSAAQAVGQINTNQVLTNINAHVRLIEKESIDSIATIMNDTTERSIAVAREQVSQNARNEIEQTTQTATLNSASVQLSELNTKIAELIDLQRNANEIARDTESAVKRNPANMANPGRRSAA
jgi:cell division septum initiation protein DivIVA